MENPQGPLPQQRAGWRIAVVAHLSQALDGSVQVHVGVLVNLVQEAAQLLQGRLNSLGLVLTLHTPHIHRYLPVVSPNSVECSSGFSEQC